MAVIIVGCGAKGVVAVPLAFEFDQEPCESRSASGLQCEMSSGHEGKHLSCLRSHLVMWRETDAAWFSTPRMPDVF